MPTQIHRPVGLKYTDMCIYIDQNVHKIVNTGEYPDVETKIYEYLYHILYALACKANYFSKWEDYDLFALYGASELFMALKNRQVNAGKIIRGREVVPVKSCLNFIKSVLFPLKINYQRQNFATIINPEVDQDTSILEGDMKKAIRSEYQQDLEDDLIEVLSNLSSYLTNILNTTPYKKDPVMLERLRISCLLSLVNDFTIPNKQKAKIKKHLDNISDSKLISIYQDNWSEVILWHLPEHIKDYVKILTIRLKHKITDEINSTRQYHDLSDEILDSILKSAYNQYDEGEY